MELVESLLKGKEKKEVSVYQEVNSGPSILWVITQQ